MSEAWKKEIGQGAAVEGVQNVKSDFRMTIANAPAEGAHPISTFTWIIVPSKMEDAAKLKAMKQSLRWGYEAGQQLAMPMDYGVLQPPLPDRVRDQIGDLH